MKDGLIESPTADRGPHYEPYGWHHWPDHPWMSYQLRRALGETQEGGGAVSECFQAASRMIPGDRESWYVEWRRVAERNDARGDHAETLGHTETAKNCWLRATDYYRSAEFWLDADDPRRLQTFSLCESAFQKAGRHFSPRLEKVLIPYEGGVHLHAYYLQSPHAKMRSPVLISVGGLDSFKEELYFMTARGALARGISCLLVDGPGQGATLRRERVRTRYDYEVPVARCIDYLATRDDVDHSRIAVCGSSLGGYYAARAASREHRLAAAVSHGAMWDIAESWAGRGDDHMLARQIKWVFGAESMAEALELARPFTLNGVLESMRCPYLILHGGYDVLGVTRAKTVYDYAKAHGVNVTLKLLSEDETGAEHCQHDNPTIGMECMMDWLADRFAITQP